MAELVQQINLFKPPKRNLSRELSASGLAVVFAIGVLLIAMAGAWVEFEIVNLERELEQVEANKAAKQKIVDMQSKLLQRGEDPFLLAELERLHGEKLNANLVVKVLRAQQRSLDRKYSEYFSGLARHPVDGLWIETFALAGERDELLIRGKVFEPAKVPRLLELLNQEPVFQGQNFAQLVFKRETEKDHDSLRFELRSHTDQGGRDAG